MTAEYLSQVGSSLVKRCGTRDPFKIAKELGIEVLLCENFGPLKGMYRVVKRNRFIFINQDLSEQMQRIVCAHELGHDQLHRSLAKDRTIREFMLYDMKSRPEYEANMYAADLLLDDDEVMELAKEGYDMQQVASILNTDINLVGLKMASMNYRGYDLRIGIEPRSDFLRS